MTHAIDWQAALDSLSRPITNVFTIDLNTEQKLVADRREYGVAYMRVLEDGRIEHVPVDVRTIAESSVSPTAVPWLRRVT